MTSLRLPIALALTALLTGSAHAADQQDLEQRGYKVLWEGVALISSCIHGKDQYDLGSYVFVCDQMTMEMLGHAGDVVLMGQPGAGRAFLCLDEDDDCVAGSVAAR